MACKPMLKIQRTDEYELLTDFFIKNDLEFSEEEPVETDIVQCWKITHGGDIVGAAALALREGKFIIDGIAVDKVYRHMKLGKLLLDKVIEEAKRRGGTEIYLVARAPEFFRRFGFSETPAEAAPRFFECLTCPQYGKTCRPKIMKLNIG